MELVVLAEEAVLLLLLLGGAVGVEVGVAIGGGSGME